MRSVHLVAYDMSDDKRRTRVFKMLKGFGEALQFSLFRCILTPSERSRLRTEMWEMIDHSTDRVLIIDLGPDDGRGQLAIEQFGNLLIDPASHQGSLII